jgi:hypothetical protein
MRSLHEKAISHLLRQGASAGYRVSSPLRADQPAPGAFLLDPMRAGIGADRFACRYAARAQCCIDRPYAGIEDRVVEAIDAACRNFRLARQPPRTPEFGNLSAAVFAECVVASCLIN